MKQQRAFWRRIAAYAFPVFVFLFSLEIGSRYYYEHYYLAETGSPASPLILTIGDSFCVMEDSFPYLLGKKLEDRYRVVNAAESGAGPDHYLMNLSLNVKKKPHVCIVSFYLGNDVLNLRDFHDAPRTSRIKLFMGSHFYTYHMFRNFWLTLKYRPSDRELENATQKGVLNPHMLKAAKQDPDVAIRNLLAEGEKIAGAWEAMGSIVAKMKNVAEENGVSLFAMLIPASIQVSDRYQAVYRKAGFRMDGETAHMTRPQELMGDILRKNQIPYLDLLQEFRKRKDRAIYFDNDPHMAPEGHLITADILIEALHRKGLLH